jgi:putative cell wall-binding protein
MATKRKWSQHVTETSDALDLENGVFAKEDPKAIAQSLKRSAEHSTRRKSSPLQSAMSMLTFFMNRGGKNLSRHRKRVLEEAKEELRRAFEID